MCGIAGIWHSDASALEASAERMANALTHRGPDSNGVWSDKTAGIALAHRRLSIIDLSQAGHQPMASASGRYVLSYNGEIYNFQSLRKQLDYPWKGHSDTEVILAAIEAWGIEKALQSFNGMFAFALWDSKERTLTLARDRMGEKPLYYGLWKDQLLFASELKAFKTLEGFSPDINRHALSRLMRYSYIGGETCIYKGFHKLKPGHYVTFSDSKKQAVSQPYWSLDEAFYCAGQNRHKGSENEILDALEALISKAVGQRMVSDVPLGAFLSGGIDSTLISTLMQQHSSAAIKTFTIGFDEAGFDEAPHAKAIAQHIKTEHTELYVSSKQALDVIPQLSQLYDEPFADSSQIPTYLVAKMAREHVTVALSGDGGDEVFGGYNRHVHAPRIWENIHYVPAPLRKVIGTLIKALPVQSSHHRQKLMQAMHAKNEAEFYRSLCSLWQMPDRLVMHTQEPETPVEITPPFAEWMMHQDLISYLPGDILTKVDRAAMGVSLETRIPFLAPEVMEFSWGLPLEMKIRNGQGKWCLRQLLYRHLPKELIDRPKAGFSLPLGQWLREPLRDWAESLLDESRLKQQGFLHPAPILDAWKTLLNGNDFMEGRLWNVLMFQSWLESQ